MTSLAIGANTEGDTEAAVTSLLSVGPEDPYVHYRAGNFYARKAKSFDKAVAHYKKACSLHGAFGDAWNSLGLLYRSEAAKVSHMMTEPEVCEKRRNELLCLAVDAFEQGIALSKQSVGVVYFSAMKNLARVHREMGDFSKAEHLLLEIVALDPNNAPAMWNLADLLVCVVAPARVTPNAKEGNRCDDENQRRVSRAIALLHEAVRVDPTFFDAFLLLGEIYENRQLSQPNNALALAMYNAALALLPTADLCLKIGQLEEKLYDLPKAKQSYEQAIAIAQGPGSATAAQLAGTTGAPTLQPPLSTKAAKKIVEKATLAIQRIDSTMKAKYVDPNVQHERTPFVCPSGHFLFRVHRKPFLGMGSWACDVCYKALGGIDVGDKGVLWCSHDCNSDLCNHCESSFLSGSMAFPSARVAGYQLSSMMRGLRLEEGVPVKTRQSYCAYKAWVHHPLEGSVGTAPNGQPQVQARCLKWFTNKEDLERERSVFAAIGTRSTAESTGGTGETPEEEEKGLFSPRAMLGQVYGCTVSQNTHSSNEQEGDEGAKQRMVPSVLLSSWYPTSLSSYLQRHVLAERVSEGCFQSLLIQLLSFVDYLHDELRYTAHGNLTVGDFYLEGSDSKQRPCPSTGSGAVKKLSFAVSDSDTLLATGPDGSSPLLRLGELSKLSPLSTTEQQHEGQPLASHARYKDTVAVIGIAIRMFFGPDEAAKMVPPEMSESGKSFLQAITSTSTTNTTDQQESFLEVVASHPYRRCLGGTPEPNQAFLLRSLAIVLRRTAMADDGRQPPPELLSSLLPMLRKKQSVAYSLKVLQYHVTEIDEEASKTDTASTPTGFPSLVSSFAAWPQWLFLAESLASMGELISLSYWTHDTTPTNGGSRLCTVELNKLQLLLCLVRTWDRYESTRGTSTRSSLGVPADSMACRQDRPAWSFHQHAGEVSEICLEYRVRSLAAVQEALLALQAHRSTVANSEEAIYSAGTGRPTCTCNTSLVLRDIFWLSPWSVSPQSRKDKDPSAEENLLSGSLFWVRYTAAEAPTRPHMNLIPLDMSVGNAPVGAGGVQVRAGDTAVRHLVRLWLGVVKEIVRLHEVGIVHGLCSEHSVFLSISSSSALDDEEKQEEGVTSSCCAPMSLLLGPPLLPVLSELSTWTVPQGHRKQLPPELLVGQPLSMASDSYGLGRLLLSLFEPVIIGFQQEELQTSTQQQGWEPCAISSAAQAFLPSVVLEVLSEMLEGDPSRRPTPLAILNRLQPFLTLDPADEKVQTDTLRQFCESFLAAHRQRLLMIKSDDTEEGGSGDERGLTRELSDTGILDEDVSSVLSRQTHSAEELLQVVEDAVAAAMYMKAPPSSLLTKSAGSSSSPAANKKPSYWLTREEKNSIRENTAQWLSVWAPPVSGEAPSAYGDGTSSATSELNPLLPSATTGMPQLLTGQLYALVEHLVQQIDANRNRSDLCHWIRKKQRERAQTSSGESGMCTLFYVEGYGDVLFYRNLILLYEEWISCQTLSNPSRTRKPLVCWDELKCVLNTNNIHTGDELLLGFREMSMTSEEISKVRMFITHDNDLQALTAANQRPGLWYSNQGTNSLSTYYHRLRYGRAIENYMVPFVVPALLFLADDDAEALTAPPAVPVAADSKTKDGESKKTNVQMLYSLCVEAVATIAKSFFPAVQPASLLKENACGGEGWIASRLDQGGFYNVATDFEHRLGQAMASTVVHATALHRVAKLAVLCLQHLPQLKAAGSAAAAKNNALPEDGDLALMAAWESCATIVGWLEENSVEAGEKAATTLEGKALEDFALAVAKDTICSEQRPLNPLCISSGAHASDGKLIVELPLDEFSSFVAADVRKGVLQALPKLRGESKKQKKAFVAGASTDDDDGGVLGAGRSTRQINAEALRAFVKKRCEYLPKSFRCAVTKAAARADAAMSPLTKEATNTLCFYRLPQLAPLISYLHQAIPLSLSTGTRRGKVRPADTSPTALWSIHRLLGWFCSQLQNSYLQLLVPVVSPGVIPPLMEALFRCTEEGCNCRTFTICGYPPQASPGDFLALESPGEWIGPRGRKYHCACCGHSCSQHSGYFQHHRQELHQLTTRSRSPPDNAPADTMKFFEALCLFGALTFDSHPYLELVRGEKCLGESLGPEGDELLMNPPPSDAAVDDQPLSGAMRVGKPLLSPTTIVDALHRAHLQWMIPPEEETLCTSSLLCLSVLKEHYGNLWCNAAEAHGTFAVEALLIQFSQSVSCRELASARRKELLSLCASLFFGSDWTRFVPTHL